MQTQVEMKSHQAQRGVAHIVRHVAGHGSIGDLLHGLIEAGIEESAAREAIDHCLRDPVLSVLMQLASRLEAHDWLFKALRTVGNHHSLETSIASRTSIARDEFAAEHYGANRPLVLRGGACGWPAIEKWTNQYLKAQCGGIPVRVMTGRTKAPIHAQNTAADLAVEMPFRDYIDRVERCGVSNDLYMVARNEFFRNAASHVLLGDLSPRPDFFEADNQGAKTYLWFGPAGTITPLHFDTRNNMLFQIRGRKHLQLFSPFDTPFLYQRYAYYSAVDCDQPDVAKTPLYASARGDTLILHPGDALFIPVGWWHYVRSLDVSISIAMTDFMFPNEYGAIAGIA